MEFYNSITLKLDTNKQPHGISPQVEPHMWQVVFWVVCEDVAFPSAWTQRYEGAGAVPSAGR